MMTYSEFIEQLKRRDGEEFDCTPENIRFYPEGYTSDDPHVVEWIKDSNMRFLGEANTKLLTDFLMMEVPRKDGYPTIQRIATRRMYQDALENGFDSAFQAICQKQKEMDSAVLDSDWMEKRTSEDYEQIREKLILRPLNYNLHIRDLHGHAYKKVGDFVLALYQLVGDSENNLVSSKIRRDEIGRWGVPDEKVFRDALENTARLFPACVYDNRTEKEENFLEKSFTKADISFSNHPILLSTFKGTNGAVALFYPGVIEKMMKIMGGPFQAVFMNINDVMIFGVKDSRAYHYAQEAKKTTKMGEMLSGRMYLCDGRQMIPGLVVNLYEDGKATVDLG